MAKNCYDNLCPLTDQIVAYIYGEIGGKAEFDFEMHLADCTDCTDEFAAVSDARFSVYEWKKEAFDPLPTPDIPIPYGESATMPWPPANWIAAVKAWAEGLSMPVAVAAGLAVCITVGALAFIYLGKTEQQVASNMTVPAITKPDPIVREEIKASDTVENTLPPAVKPVQESSARPQRIIKRTPNEPPKPANNFAPNRGTQALKAPALTPDQEPDDNSLRLADLFDEVGG